MGHKHIFCAAVLTGSLFLSLPARADVYFGADFTHSDLSYKDDNQLFFNDNYNMIGPVVGFEVNGIGVEGFYKMSDNTDNDNGQESKLKSYGADFVLALPTNEYIDFVASAGYVHHELSYKKDDGTKFKQSGKGPRFGIGMQFNLNRHLALRAMYHYTSLTSGIDEFDYINEVTAGIRIGF